MARRLHCNICRRVTAHRDDGLQEWGPGANRPPVRLYTCREGHGTQSQPEPAAAVVKEGKR